MQLNWISLTSIQEADLLIQRSYERPCLILKHSTRCEVSAIAKYRLEDDWTFETSDLEAYYLDVLKYGAVSKYLAEVFSVYHESPQVLLVVDGECVYDTSHLDISVDEVREALTGITG